MRALIGILVASIAVIAAGCGGTSDATPVACLDGPGAYVGALGDAPGEVRLSGEVPISDCLAKNQNGGDLAAVGTAMVSAATELNAEARADPGGAANLQLGYLLGAAQRGGRRDRRHPRRADPPPRRRRPLQPRQPPLSPQFLRTYRRGYDAGHARG